MRLWDSLLAARIVTTLFFCLVEVLVPGESFFLVKQHKFYTNLFTN